VRCGIVIEVTVVKTNPWGNSYPEVALIGYVLIEERWIVNVVFGLIWETGCIGFEVGEVSQNLDDEKKSAGFLRRTLMSSSPLHDSDDGLVFEEP